MPDSPNIREARELIGSDVAGVDAEGIQRILPHRYPFLLVDRVIELVPPHRAVGIKQVPSTSHSSRVTFRVTQ